MMIKHFILITILLFSLAANAETTNTTGTTLFTTEVTAQQHCPSDTVVWVNTASSVYHFKGQRWYGNTKSGAYVCEKEADQAGDRATRNGQ